MPGSNASMSLIIIALGFLGVILSFLVADRKKSVISLILAGLIILAGAIQYSTQTISRYKWKKRMQEIQRDRQVDLDDLRKRLKEQAQSSNNDIKK